MVDMSIAGAPSGTDAVSLLRSGRSKNSDDDSNGFFDALNNSGSGKTATGTGDATDDDTVGATDTTKDSDLPDAQVKGSIVAPSSTDLDAATIPANAATIANAALFPKALTTSTSTTLPTSANPLSGKADSAAAATDTADATVADAMASLGVAPATDTDLTPVISTTGTAAAPTDGKTAAPTLPTAGAVPSLTSKPISVQPPLSDAAPVVPAQPDAATPVQTAPDMMQQLAAIVGDNASAQPVVDGKTVPAATTGKTQSASSGDDDTKTDSDTTKEDATADATDSNLSGAVTDALSLLNAAAPMAAQAQAAPGILAGAGQVVPSAGKSQTSASTGSAAAITLPRGKASAVVADTLDTDTAAAADGKTTAMPKGLAALAAGVSGGAKSGTATTTDDSSTATFRIARADGKAMDMSISKNADDTTQADVQTATGTGTETVTVLDSRRYLGLADGSNSALVANTLAGNKEWSSAMRTGPAAATTAVVSNTSKVVNTLKIQMNPEKLGTVTATMRLAGDSLSVDLKVQSAEAYRQLSSDQGPMIDSLRAQGYTVDHITVSYAPQATTTADTSSQQQSSQAGFQGQQQSGASQGQGGEAQSRRQNSGQRTGDQDGIWGTQNVGSDDSAAGNTQRTRSSGVYL